MPHEYTQEEQDLIDSNQANLEAASEKVSEHMQFLEEQHVAVPLVSHLTGGILSAIGEELPILPTLDAMTDGSVQMHLRASLAYAYYLGLEMGKAGQFPYEHPCNETSPDHQHGRFDDTVITLTENVVAPDPILIDKPEETPEGKWLIKVVPADISCPMYFKFIDKDWQAMQAEIGGYIERVRLGRYDGVHVFEEHDEQQFVPSDGSLVLIVDENGIIMKLPLNERASKMYGTQFHGQEICGDAFLMGEGITDEGPNFISYHLEG